MIRRPGKYSVIKLFIKHMIFEKAIDVLFDGIARAFNKPNIFLGIRNERRGGKLIKTLTHEYKGEIHTINMIISNHQMSELIKLHNLSEKEVNDMFDEGLRQEARIEIRLKEDPDYFESTKPERDWEEGWEEKGAPYNPDEIPDFGFKEIIEEIGFDGGKSPKAIPLKDVFEHPYLSKLGDGILIAD